MGVIEIMELIGEGVMYPTCVCLHIKPLKLSPEMACRPIFFHLYPLKHIQAVMKRPPVGYFIVRIEAVYSLQGDKTVRKDLQTEKNLQRFLKTMPKPS